VTTLAGTSRTGCVDGGSETACFEDPRALAIDEKGRVLVAEEVDHLDSRVSGEMFGCLRIISTSMPWAFARVLFIGLLKSNAGNWRGEGGGGRGTPSMSPPPQCELAKTCVLGMLPLDGPGLAGSWILSRIIALTWPRICPPLRI